MPDCETITYDDPGQVFGYTTTTATAIKGSLELAVTGEPFICSEFTTPNSGGMLAAPAPTTLAPFGDSANVFRLAEALTERVFGIAAGTAFATAAETGSGMFIGQFADLNFAQSIGAGPLTLSRRP